MGSVLFTCAGTSEPVRGMRDGAMLHIIRHYRPDKVYLFLSQEVTGYENKDHRFAKTIAYVSEHLVGDYAPELVVCHSGIVNVADMDVVYEPMLAFFKEAVLTADGDQLIINLTSGSPQMQIILAQLALSTQGKTLGVQVMNPENRAGTTERTNDKSYAVEEELECNDDNAPDAPNRCVEPRMLAMRRNAQRTHLVSLLKMLDYQALLTMEEALPPRLMPLVKHLAARSDLKQAEAWDLAKQTSDLALGFSLYPAKGAANAEYRQLSEYYLLLRNLQQTGRYSEFVLRLNPFLTHLVLRLLEISLPCALSDFVETVNGRKILAPDRLEKVLPAEKRTLERQLNRLLQRAEISLYVAVPFLRVLHGREDTASRNNLSPQGDGNGSGRTFVG